MKKDKLPYAFIVVFYVFVAFSVAWNWHPRLQEILGSDQTGAKFCVLWSISTDHLNQGRVRAKYRKCMGSHVAHDIKIPRTVRMVRLWLNFFLLPLFLDFLSV